MNLTMILYSFILGLINHNLLTKIPLLSFFGIDINLTITIIIDIIIFIILEVILYKNTTLKQSVIVSLIRIGSWFIGYLVDYLIIMPMFQEVFNNTAFKLLHMVDLKIIFFLISTSTLIGIIISANREDKWIPNKEKSSN